MDTRETTRVFQDEQGTYHWVYRLPMFKNFSILFTLLKAMGIGLLLIMIFIMALIFSDGIEKYDPKLAFGVPLAVIVFALALSVACYFLVAFIYGGYYVAIYSMDRKGITQYQPADQADKNKVMSLFEAAAGIVAGNPALLAAGFITGARMVVSTAFSDIKSLTVVPSLGEIRVHSFLTWYTVYVSPEDFDFVANFMIQQSTNAVVKEK